MNTYHYTEDSYEQTILDLLERPYPVHSGLLAPQEIRTELIKKDEIYYQ